RPGARPGGRRENDRPGGPRDRGDHGRVAEQLGWRAWNGAPPAELRRERDGAGGERGRGGRRRDELLGGEHRHRLRTRPTERRGRALGELEPEVVPALAEIVSLKVLLAGRGARRRTGRERRGTPGGGGRPARVLRRAAP